MKNALDKRFDELLRELHSKYFRLAGFKKTGSNFRMYLPNGVFKIVNFQKSMYNDEGACSFTVNLGIYFEKNPENPNLKFKEYECAVRTRISAVSQRYSSDQWWTITEALEDEKLREELASVVAEDVLPWLAQFSSKEETIRLGQQGALAGMLWKLLD